MKEKRDKQYIFYRILRSIVWLYFVIFKPYKVIGRENFPEGSAVICANHSSMGDPFYMAFALPSRYHLCLMAKKELFKFKPLAWALRGIGTFPVDRESTDLEAMKNALNVLKAGKKLGIFPEGTRTDEDGAVSPKAGAVRLAQKTGAPVVPMYIPRKKRWFRRITLVVGEPYVIEKKRMTHEEMEKVADDLMDKIALLGHTIPEKRAA